MRRLVERHKQKLSSFLEQRRDLLLVVLASDADAVLVLQLTSELDEGSDEDLFVTLGGEFYDADSYGLAAAQQFAAQHALAAAAVHAAGKPPLPPLPPQLLAAGRPGRERLMELVVFAHELLPREARRLVVVVVPTLIADRTAFLALVAHLLPRPERERWMARLRVIIRDEASDESLGARQHPLASVTPAGVCVTHVDFSQEAIRASLAATADDETAPLPERMQALLSSAIVDGVYGQHAPALAKLERVLAYYQVEKNALMQAVTVNAMGEVCLGGGALDLAQHWFECALPLAIEAESALALATAAKNLGSLCAQRGDHANAVQYFDGLAQIAPKLLDNETQSWALEQRGLSEAALGKNGRAIETWRQGADLCRNTDHVTGLRGHLAHLRDAYAGAGRLLEQHQVERELGGLTGGPPHG
jgi:tetratricopeptide (TPR) repeat protein